MNNVSNGAKKDDKTNIYYTFGKKMTEFVSAVTKKNRGAKNATCLVILVTNKKIMYV